MGDPRLLLLALALFVVMIGGLRRALAGRSASVAVASYLGGVLVTVLWTGTLHTDLKLLNDRSSPLRASTCYGQTFESCRVSASLPDRTKAGSTTTVRIKTREVVPLVLWGDRGTPTCLLVQPALPWSHPETSATDAEVCTSEVVRQIQAKQRKLRQR